MCYVYNDLIIKSVLFQIHCDMSKKKHFLSCLLLCSFSLVHAQNTITFNFAGTVEEWIVPACTYEITITAAGAQGGGNVSGVGGLGSITVHTIDVLPGQILQIRVGGQGGLGDNSGGWNGGGTGHSVNSVGQNSSGGGGGASDVRTAPYDLVDRIIVAGGGGGSNGGSSPYLVNGGAAGCKTAPIAPASVFLSSGAQGGSQYSGGAGGLASGSPNLSGTQGESGSLGQGGHGGNHISESPGGGGGGGLFGGGGGSSDYCCLGANGGGSGAGGSSFPVIGCTANTNSGHGYITISWFGAQTPGFYPSAPSIVCLGEDINFQLNSSNASNVQWWGPNNFSSNEFNPVIPGNSINTESSGTYFVSFLFDACLDTISFDIAVKDDTAPVFTNLPIHLCPYYLPTLPTNSDNAVQGFWNPPTTNLNTNTYIFSPMEFECTTETFEIFIPLADTIIPEFPLNIVLCAHNVFAPLSNTSANGISGQWLPTFNPEQSQNYVFFAENSACAQLVSTYVLIVQELALNVVQIDNMLVEQSGLVSYEWYLNNELLPDENSNFITPMENGLYTVVGFNEYDCYGSENISISNIFSTLDLNYYGDFTLYPNPNSGLFQISGVQTKGQELNVYNIHGQLIFNTACENFPCELDLATLADGVYYLVIEQQQLRFVIIR